MAGRFSKQGAPQLTQGPYLNSNNSGDAVVGGALSSTVYSQIGANQGSQNVPGDRFIFTPSDCLALSNPNAFGGQLFSGTYRYVLARNNSAAIPQPGRAAFWSRPGNNGNNDAFYEVTPDENATVIPLFAGFYINWIPLGNFWFIQESGKTTCQFQGNNGTAAFGGANGSQLMALGQGAYLAATGAANANNTVGLVTCFTGGNSAAIFSTVNGTTAYTAIDQMMTRYLGPVETLPSNGNYSLVDVNIRPYRW